MARVSRMIDGLIPFPGQTCLVLRAVRLLSVGFFSLCLLPVSAQSQVVYQDVVHNQGNIQTTLSNNGFIGSPRYDQQGQPIPVLDVFTGEEVLRCIYPRGSDESYLEAFPFFGGVVGNDTLVSGKGWELTPSVEPLGLFESITSDKSKSHYSPNAYSELDHICTYSDTVVIPVGVIICGLDNRDHIPMGLQIRQRSMAWSAELVDDFIMIEFEITNIGDRDIGSFYVGFVVEGISYDLSSIVVGGVYSGFIEQSGSSDSCFGQEEIGLAYVIDNDGDPHEGLFNQFSARSSTGIMLLGSSADFVRVNYNWWTGISATLQYWTPQKQGTLSDPYRDLGLGNGCFQGDRSWYYVMSHPEVDYNQITTGLDHTSEGWLPRPPDWREIAAGIKRPTFLYSFGPFDIPRRDKINFTIAIVGGENVHHDPTAFDRLFDPLNPQPFYDQLDFSNLIENARWAKRVYDNPGVDTDGDGYFGEFCLQDGDTVWYEGDGIPDFRANTPPPAPFVRVLTRNGELVIRWNGYQSETTKDQFVGVVDFEGYNVYSGLDDRRSSLTLLTSYDRQNYLRYRFELLPSGEGRWTNEDFPLTLDSLKILYSDPDFEPLDYTRIRPLFYGDEHWYFEEMGFNRSEFGQSSLIRKAYPQATDPGLDTTLWTEDDVTYEHDGKRLPKFYEYEYVHDNLMPSRPYYVTVTAFDFGSQGGKIPPQENNPLNNLILAYAQTAAEVVEEEQLDAYVYPNPYRVDAHYAERGYENRKGNIIPDRARLIHFANLPRVCTISIFSLDGDLIGTIEHNYPEGGPEAMHDWWNLVSRSGLAVTSGLYYWVVESDTRTQIGKFVILK